MTDAGAAGARPALRAVVTRPRGQAEPAAAELHSHGIDAVVLPLIEIAAPADVDAVVAAWSGLAACDLVVFVSSNAVQRFFAARPAGIAWPAKARAAAPGPGTAESLRGFGLGEAAVIEPAGDAAQHDSEALWQRLGEETWRGRRVLVVRGDGGRDWLAERLREAGARVDAVAVYRRTLPRWSDPERATLNAILAAPAQAVWLFTSSQAVDHLQQLVAAEWGAHSAVASHPRIAERARAAGFGRVLATSPGLASTVGCIQSIQP